MTANKKIKRLIQTDEDREWYPTTDEILSAMNNDLHLLFTEGDLAGNGGGFPCPYRKRTGHVPAAPAGKPGGF